MAKKTKPETAQAYAPSDYERPKPHERNLQHDWRRGEILDLRGVVARDVADDYGPLFAAAPAMARALLGLLAQHAIICDRATAEAVTDAQAALRKAGVLP